MRSFAKSVQRLFSAEHLLFPGYPAKNTHHFPVPSAKVKVRKSPTSGGLGLEGECCLCCYATSQQKKSRRQTDAEMSSNYSANQYDSAFRSHRLQNWCETKCVNQRPTAHGGQTTFTSDNRGHLLPGVVKRGSAWPDFKGTWDLPARIPAHRINPTSRSVEGLDMLKCWGFDLQYTGTSQPHSKNKYPKNVGMQTNGDVRRDAAAMSSAAEARQPTQNLPIPGDRGPASQNHDPQAAVVRPIGEPDEEKPARQAAEPVQRDEE